MNKYLNKTLVFILSLILAFTFVGCNSGGGNKDGDGSVKGPDTSQVVPDVPSITMLESKELVLGESFILSPTKKNLEGEYVWTSSNPAVVTVLAGKVSAINTGTAIITASIGETYAKCSVTVTYGDFKPELLTYSQIENDKINISMGGSFNLYPYVKYNGIEFDDATYSYSSDNERVVTVEDGVVTAVNNGTANVTISANWRGFTASEEPLLTKTVTVSVKDDVTFLLNGALANGFTLQTPANFIPESERNNVVEFIPTVTVNGGEPIEVTSVTLTPMGETVAGVDYDCKKIGKRYVYTAHALGKCLVTLKYKIDEDVHAANFYIDATRPTKVVEERVEYFNLKTGTVKVKKDGAMVTSTLLKEFWSDGAALYDAYDENGEMLSFTSDGEIIGVKSNTENQTSYHYTTVVLGTKTEIYEIPLRAAGHFMFDKEDVVSALIASPYTVGETDLGYFPVMNDIDMEGTAVNSYLTGGFGGVFDGRGNVIYNIVSDTTTYTVNGEQKRGGGLFNYLTGTVKNVAFINLKGVQSGSHSYVGLLGREFHKGTLENVYIDVNPDTLPKGIGIFYNIGSESVATFKNTVINYPGPAGYTWSENEYIENCEQSGYSAKRGVLGGGLAYYSKSDTFYTVKSYVNAVNLTVISPMPLYHSTPSTIPTGYTSKVDSTDWFAYAENETELWYQHSYLDEFYPNHSGEHTVKSAGEIVGRKYQFKVNEKVRVVPGIRRYDDMISLVLDNSEDMQAKMTELSAAGYFVLVDGAPVWHKLVDGYASVTANGTQLENATLDINCYSQVEIGVVSGEQFAESVTLTESSNLISVSGNKVVAEKIGTGATLNVSYVWGGKVYDKQITVNVLNPFNFYADGSLVESSFEKLLGSTAELQVKIGETVVSDVAFTESVDGLSINGNVLSIEKVVENAEITATFNYLGTEYKIKTLFSTIDPVSERAVVTSDGNSVDGSVEITISEEVLIGVTVDGKAANVLSLEVTGDKFEINGDKVSAIGYGESQLVIIFETDGVSHKKVLPIYTVWEIQAVTESVDYDADEGELKYNYEGDIIQITINYDENEIFLSKENGGVVDGRLYSKTGKDDENAGVPYITAADYVTTMKIELYTSVKAYVFNSAKYCTFVIETAEEYERAFDYGDYNYQGVGNGTFEYKLHDGIYVLANDIDMTGVTVENRIDYLTFTAPEYKISSSNVGFSGIFDGRGHTVSNATLKTDKKYTYVSSGQYGNIPSGHKNHQSYGLFHSVLKGAVIKNVAYINVLATNGTATTNSLTGVIARSFAGTLENVYLDINAQTKLMKGVAFSLDATAKIKNVVVNFPKPEGFAFDYVAATTDTSELSNYAYGYGALAGGINKAAAFENVYVVSNFPLYHKTDANSKTTDGDDYFVYGENETEYWFNHTANDGKPLEEIIVENSSGDTSSARRISGVRRYGSILEISFDTSDKNSQILGALTNGGYFKVVDNQIMWFDHKVTKVISSSVNYDASTGSLNTTELPSGIKSVTVNGVVLTEENGGLIKNGSGYLLRAKTSDSDDLAGIPYVVHGDSQYLNFVVDTEDKTYNFTNVVYWTEIISTPQQIMSNFSLGVYDETKTYSADYGLYLLKNDVDMSSLGNGNLIQNNVRYQSIPGNNSASSWKFAATFNGLFDGAGYSVKNAIVDLNTVNNYNQSGGFFGIVSGGVVKNVAFVNYKAQMTTGTYQGLLAHTLQDKARIENVYFDLSKDSVSTVALWGSTAYTKAHIKNVVINIPMPDGFEWNDDVYATVSVGGWKSQYGVLGSGIEYLSTLENVYAITPRPVLYIRPSSKPSLDSVHHANGWGDNDSLTTDYFFYGENETELWYSHSILDTLDVDNKGKHTVQTVVAKNTSGKARVLNNVRRYDDITALKTDVSLENSAMIDELVKTGFWVDVDGAPVWKSLTV